MAKLSKSQRNDIMNLIIQVFNDLDKTKENSKYYLDMFGKMSDDDFSRYFEELMLDPDGFLTLNVLPFHNEPRIEDMEKVAKKLDVVLEQKVAYPHISELSGDRKEIENSGHTITRYPVPVGYLHVKRLSQIVSKKTSYSTNDVTVRNALTNQITSESKIARSTDAESFALITLNANHILKELLGARADNKTKNANMLNLISRTGSVAQVDLDQLGDPRDNVSLNLVDIFFMGAGLKTDLVTDGLMLLNSYIQAGHESLKSLKKNFDEEGNLIKESADLTMYIMSEYEQYLDTNFMQEMVIALKSSDPDDQEHVRTIAHYHQKTINSLSERYPEIQIFGTMKEKINLFVERMNSIK